MKVPTKKVLRVAFDLVIRYVNLSYRSENSKRITVLEGYIVDETSSTYTIRPKLFSPEENTIKRDNIISINSIINVDAINELALQEKGGTRRKMLRRHAAKNQKIGLYGSFSFAMLNWTTPAFIPYTSSYFFAEFPLLFLTFGLQTGSIVPNTGVEVFLGYYSSTYITKSSKTYEMTLNNMPVIFHLVYKIPVFNKHFLVLKAGGGLIYQGITVSDYNSGLESHFANTDSAAGAGIDFHFHFNSNVSLIVGYYTLYQFGNQITGGQLLNFGTGFKY